MHRLALIAALAAATPAFAEERRGDPAGRFDFYVLALSWSATYCANEGARRDGPQCRTGRNPGFVLHGLWPQYERGYPAYCGPQGRSPSRAAMEKAEQIFPDPGLARHQWRKHGSCSGEDPASYFAASAAARAKVTVPDALRAPERDRQWEVIGIERAFAAANPGLRPDMMSVTCRGGQLKEVRICLSRDLRGFRTCEEVDRDRCRAREVNVPAAR